MMKFLGFEWLQQGRRFQGLIPPQDKNTGLFYDDVKDLVIILSDNENIKRIELENNRKW